MRRSSQPCANDDCVELIRDVRASSALMSCKKITEHHGRFNTQQLVRRKDDGRAYASSSSSLNIVRS